MRMCLSPLDLECLSELCGAERSGAVRCGAEQRVLLLLCGALEA